jgi:hypothetical protein
MSDMFLMCKDNQVFNITKNIIINEALVPGAIKNKTLSYEKWAATRYSAGSNITARRLLMRASGGENHNKILKPTRMLSLSDCYWLKNDDEEIAFDDVTPYLNAEWDGNSRYEGGSVSTLFVNGAADKKWENAGSLLKIGSFKEHDAYRLCEHLGIAEFASKTCLTENGISVENFTSLNSFLESFEQSGLVKGEDSARELAVRMYGERAAALFAVDYLVEHDDRHWGNIGILRDANTGAYISMAPYFDFDWIWTGFSVELPDMLKPEFSSYIIGLCEKASANAESFEKSAVIKKRAAELAEWCKT